MSKILFNIPDNIKSDFKRACRDLGLNMSHVIVSLIIKFIEEAKQKP